MEVLAPRLAHRSVVAPAAKLTPEKASLLPSRAAGASHDARLRFVSTTGRIVPHHTRRCKQY